VQLDLFETAYPRTPHAPDATPAREDPAGLLQAHFAGTRRLPLATLQRTVRQLAESPDAEAASLLLAVCAHYGPWENTLGATPEVQAALAGLERLDAGARRRAAAELARRKPVTEVSLPALLRAEVAAAAMPDDGPLRTLLGAPSAYLREAACRVAGLRGTGRLLPDVRVCAQDRVPSVRTAAVLALAELGDDAVRQPLEQRLMSAVREGTSPTRLLEALSQVADHESGVILRRVRPSLAPQDRDLADELLDDLATRPRVRARGSHRP
jgi:hypothetical protein